MRLTTVRQLGVGGSLALALLLGGCGDDEPDPGPTDPSSTGASSADPTPSPTDAGSDQTGGTPDLPALPREAEVAEFCAAMLEIDEAIDDSDAGDDASWSRVVDAFDVLYDLGVPADFPDDALAQVEQVAVLVRDSSSVEEFGDAVDAAYLESRAVDDYLDEHCQ